MRILMCLALLAFAGCSSLDDVEKVLPVHAVIGACDTCGSSGACTPCCHACAVELCYGTCRRYPPDCGMCEENAYWDCFQQNCSERE